MRNIQANHFRTALDKAQQDSCLTREDLLVLLNAQGEECTQLYEIARQKRTRYFGDRVFAYGFVYFSTYCRNNCTFCFYRRENAHSMRYRKSAEEVLGIASNLKESGVHLIDLTMGEDPQYVSTAAGEQELLSLASKIQQTTQLPLMLSPGVLSDDAILQAGKQGIELYACYQETHTVPLYEQLRSGQSYAKRWNAKRTAQAAGMLVEEGILTGVGETLYDIADSILCMASMGAAQVRVMSFVPQVGAPLQTALEGDLYTRELNTIAVMRLMMPNRLIPASLDVAGKAGLKERLDAGANIVTSIISPSSGLAGVSNAVLDVENGGRTVAGIAATLASCGLTLGTQTQFAEVLKKLRMECSQVENRIDWRSAAGS